MSASAQPQPLLRTPEEAAPRLRVTVRTVTRWCREGRIPGAVKIGGTWLIPEATLIAYETGAASAPTPAVKASTRSPSIEKAIRTGSRRGRRAA